MTTKRHRLRTDRDSRGLFLPGNKASPGRLPKQLEQEYLRTTYSACTLKAWKAIVRKAVRDARAGDAPARSWLSKQLGLEQMRLTVDLPQDQYQEQVREMLSRVSDADLAEMRRILERAQRGNSSDDSTTVH